MFCGLYSWRRHQMETFSALLALCEGNPLVTGEFLSQRPVTRSFDVYFELRLNKILSKQSWAGDLRRHRSHYDVIVMLQEKVGLRRSRMCERPCRVMLKSPSIRHWMIMHVSNLYWIQYHPGLTRVILSKILAIDVQKTQGAAQGEIWDKIRYLSYLI